MEDVVFFLSGLGADERAFKALKLSFAHRVRHIKWLIPEKNETLKQYAKRLIEKHKITSKNSLVGLSFGGLMAIELQSILGNDKVILISSASHKREIHPFVRFTSFLGLYRFIPKRRLNEPNPLLHKGFSIKNDEHKHLLNSILRDTNVDFAHWALKQMSKWQMKHRSKGVIKIHGDSDRMIPNNNTSTDYTIKGGGHFMIVDRSNEISDILNELI